MTVPPVSRATLDAAIAEICNAYDGGQSFDAQEVFARFGLRVVRGSASLAERLKERHAAAIAAKRAEEDTKPATTYVTDYGTVVFDPPVTGGAARAIAELLHGEVAWRWLKGESGPWKWTGDGLHA